MIRHPCRILYGAATGLEKALVDVDGGRLIGIPAERVRDMWDPWAISNENLPTLAWAMGARLWSDDWQDHTKREWTANQWQYQALRGTRAGIEMALKTMGRDFTGGYDLLDVLAAPQGFYASPDLPKEEWDSWIRQMPELRIQLSHRTGAADGEWYVSDKFVGEEEDGFAGRNDGPILYGRRAVLRWPGRPDQDIGVVETDAAGAERISIPGVAGAAFIAGEDFESEERFVDADEIRPDIYSFALNGAYDHVASQLHLSTLAPGLTPIDVQYERVSDTGSGNSFIFVQDFADDYFADNGRDAAELLADRVFLLDPRIATPMTIGVSFAGVDRVDYPSYNAEALVDLKTKEPGPAWITEEAAADEGFAIPDDWRNFDRARLAISGPGGAKALRDKVMADFEVTHPLRLGEPIHADPDTRFGDQRPSWL